MNTKHPHYTVSTPVGVKTATEIGSVIGDVLYPIDPNQNPIQVNSIFVLKNRPQGGGFLLELDNGKIGYCPRDLFFDMFKPTTH